MQTILSKKEQNNLDNPYKTFLTIIKNKGRKEK